jgi:hypothetical protein
MTEEVGTGKPAQHKYRYNGQHYKAGQQVNDPLFSEVSWSVCRHGYAVLSGAASLSCNAGIVPAA